MAKKDSLFDCTGCRAGLAFYRAGSGAETCAYGHHPRTGSGEAYGRREQTCAWRPRACVLQPVLVLRWRW
jgi:hypothetical protein